tara:strand:+ start:3411 stop:3545 length:135 start_codon:yes stop_codon:yes gene_type:complete
MFLFERLCRDVDKINDVEDLREVVKTYIKLYLKQTEVVANVLKM